MADVVQFRMERMTDELDDLHHRGLFTRPEIAEIVRRRRDFEYRLKRPSPLKQDFLAYIDYEIQLDALRVLRKRAIIGAMDEIEDEVGDAEEEGRKKKKRRSKKWKKSISDVAGILRILDIFRLVSMKYRGDLSIWFKYLEFCRERKHGRMKQVLAQAIRYHPKVPGLWIYAAAWEFDQNLNVTAARALMQSGLRSCPESEDLWIEYLRMEITYLNKLKARKVALGEDVKALQRDSRDAKEWTEENKELFMPLNEDKEDTEASSEQGDVEKRENFFWQQGTLILQTIYQGAIKALPSSMSLRQRFLDILHSVDLAHSDELKVEIMEDFKRDFSMDEDYWNWFARLQLGSDLDYKHSKTEFLSKLERTVQVFEEALKTLPTVKMFSLYAKFWLDVIAPPEENSTMDLNDIGIDVKDFYPKILSIYERAESSGSLTEELACQYVSFYLQTESLEEARDLLKKLCSGKLSKAAKLWTLRISTEIKWHMSKSSLPKKDDLELVFKLLQDALSALSFIEAEDLWFMALKLFSNDKKKLEKLIKILVIAMAKVSSGNSKACVASAIVSLVLQREGIQQARQMYKRFLALPRPSLHLFSRCIELECNIGFLGDNSGIVNARKLYESALGVYSNNRELWRNYYLMEMKAGTSEKATAIYSRARKVIKDDSAFLIPSDL